MEDSDSARLSPAPATSLPPSPTYPVSPPSSLSDQSAISIQDDSGNNVPEVETTTSGEELTQVSSGPHKATQVSSVAGEVSADSKQKILPPDGAVPAAPPPVSEEGRVSPDARFPPSIDQDGDYSLVDKGATLALEGDGGVEVSSQSLDLEENSEVGSIDVEVQKKCSLGVNYVESMEKDELLGGGLSEEANGPISKGTDEKKAVQLVSSEVGVVEGVEVNRAPKSTDERIEVSMESEAPATEVEEVGDTVAAGSIRVLKDEGDPNSVFSQANNVEVEKIEAGDGIDSQRNIDVAEEAQAKDALTKGLEAADSPDVNQIPGGAQSTDVGEDVKSSYIESKVPGTLGVEEDGTLAPVLDEEVEFTADGCQIAATDEIMGVYDAEEEEQEEGFVSDGSARVAILESSEAAKQIIEEMEMEEDPSNYNDNSRFVHSTEYARVVDGEIIIDSDEEVDTDEEGDGEEIFNSAALTALLKAAAGASPGDSITINSQNAGRIFSAEHPVGLGSSVPSLKPASARSVRPSISTPSELSAVGEDENMDEEERKLHDKVDQIRVKFLRLVHRLGHSPEDSVAAQVLYRLGLAEGIKRGRQNSHSFSLESAKRKALQLEADGKEDLDLSCTVLVLGKTGVGKSATINSILGDHKAHTNAFRPDTTYVKEISGNVDGVNIRVIDTPGLSTSAMDQSSNRKVLSSIKRFTKRNPPDIVLYVDRLDTQTRDLNDLPLLRSITTILGSSIWFNAVVALTHAASAPPDGPNGSALSYEMFVAHRSHVVQHCIRQAAGDMRLINSVTLVENHPSCRRNREGESVLPNGLSWRPRMLLLCYSLKILSEVNSLLKLQGPSPGKLNFRFRSPPLPYLLSSLLQSRAHPKLSTELGGENDDSDIDLDDLLDENEEEEEYDQLPPFKPLRKSQIAKLTKEQCKAYFEEYDYRVKLLQKKQWKEEHRRIKEMKKRGKSNQDDFGYGYMAEDIDQEGAPSAVSVPLPDMLLPPSFDCDNPVYRYRFLEPTSELLTRPVLDTHGWDHDCGYDGISIEQTLALAGCFPAAIAIQVTKDKKDFNIQLDSSISAKHGENGSTLLGFDIQSVGRQLAYVLQGETKFNNFKKNKTAGGISVTFLGETVATGLKIEDQISIGKRVNLVASTGAIRAEDDVAYGANLEVHLRDKDYPIGQALSTLGLSLMKWRSDLALGANLQFQFSVGRNSKMAVRMGLNNKLSGQITVKTSTSEQLQIALLGIFPIAVSLIRNFWPGESYLAH